MKIVGILLLVAAGLLALLVTACGGLFSFMAFGGMGARGPAFDVLTMSLPALVVGIAGLIACVRGVRKLIAPEPADASVKEEAE